LPSLFSKKERYFVLGLAILIIASLITWYSNYRLTRMVERPDYGGSYTEGIVGSPQYINPILCQTNDTDQDISELIFSGLMKYDSKGNLVPDLAERYAVGEGGKIYDFFLRKNVFWHDGKPFNADDVIFTFQTIQNPNYKSPLIFNWSGVEIEKIDDWTVRFKLKNAYAPFLNSATVGMLPKHIWVNMSPAEFLLAETNLKPIGTGPYKFKKFEKDRLGSIKTLYLEADKNYYPGKPYIKNITFKFYINEEAMINAYNSGTIKGLGFITAQNKSQLKNYKRKLNIYPLKLPRYFAVFFNQSKSKALSDKTVRLALNYATNKQEIIDRILNGEGEIVNTPIPKEAAGYSVETKIYDFALEHANNLLDAAGWNKNNETGIREKVIKKGESPTPLEITLITTEWPELQRVAEILQEQWSKVGAKIEVKILNIAEIQQDYIRPREYQALLFGEVLGAEPDPFPFWHSSQKRDPGLNLALYDNANADKLLMEARIIFDSEKRKEKYEEFQKLVVEDVPVVFLYNPYYLYPVSKKIKGIEIENIPIPSKRFSGIENWYIETKRVKKDQVPE
jgi:peptide/nickel transport system substrate-binding protein